MKHFLLAVFFILCTGAFAQTYIINTIAGNGTMSYSGDGGPATAAELAFPCAEVKDIGGTVYIADENNNRIRMVGGGMIYTFAGNGTGGFSGDGGPAAAAELYWPTDIVMDGAHNFYIADYANRRIRMVNTSGIISTIAGNGAGGYFGDGGPATAAEFYLPWGIARDGAGNLYIADGQNNNIRIVNTSGIINTFAGNRTAGYSGDGGPATAAELNNYVANVKTDGAGNIYISDTYNHRIRKVNTSGIISTIAGNGTAGFSGDGGPATAAELNYPAYVIIDGAGNIYIADGRNSRIRKVNTSGVISTIAGSGVNGFSGDGGAAIHAAMGWPTGLVMDGAGDIYFADQFNNRVRELTPAPALSAYVLHYNDKCYGYCNGSAWAVVSGGIPPYSFSWAPSGGTRDTAVNLCAGTYTCTITDAASSTLTVSITISQPSQLRDSISAQTNIVCPGMCNGSLTVGVKGGTPTYTYLWSPGGQTTTRITGLCAGCYTVTVTDANSCSVTATSCITQPTQLKDSICMVRNVTCNGDNNGCLGACVSGGTPPYTYLWTPTGGTGDSLCNLIAGCYTLTVTDANGCSSTATHCITQPNPLTVFECGATNVSCHGGSNGCIIACVTGGTQPYSYFWSNAATSDTVCSLTAGCYTVTVTDAYNCTGTMSYCLTQPGFLGAVASASPDSICVGGCTTLKVTASGNTPPYAYRWSTGATTTTVSVCPASTTTYSVTVIDSTCSDSVIVTVLVTVDICTGITSINSANNDIILYPNPNNGVFTLHVKNEKLKVNSVVEIYNMLGEKVFTLPLSQAGERTQIDMSKQPAGIYLYRLLSETGNLVSEGKFVITK